MDQFRRILLRPIEDNERTRRRQCIIDDYVDDMKERWDVGRGLCGSRGLELPHESVAGYWELSDESGRYRVALPQGLISTENPGNCTLSRGHLFYEIVVERTG